MFTFTHTDTYRRRLIFPRLEAQVEINIMNDCKIYVNSH